MSNYLIAFDLGTGGAKASLYNYEGSCLAETFFPYQTFYPKIGWHEQCPEDWWNAIVYATQRLLFQSRVPPAKISAIGISGHSLGVVPLDKNGNLLREKTPIWSDSRSSPQTDQFFKFVREKEWYSITGNGFPSPHYSVFKVMWYRDNEPEMFRRIHKVIGTKDFINFKLTGKILTDYSYASGSGVFDLMQWDYSENLIKASKLPRDIFPEIFHSTQIIGNLNKFAANELGLPRSVQVVAGGVDNSCMAVGARNIQEGRVYNNQGSSSGIAVTSKKPILDENIRPFVFSAVIPGLFNSAVPVFSAGSSFRWVRDQFCKDLFEKGKIEKKDIYELMTAIAEKSPVGSNGVIFHPNLAGGSSIDASRNIRGAFIGLDLGHVRSDILRAAMEGISLELAIALKEFRKKYPIGEDIVVVGGGSRSKLWRQIYADTYQMRIIKTNIDQQAAALGAAALAAVGIGVWKDFYVVDEIHQVLDITNPIPENVAKYEKIMSVFSKAGLRLSEIGDIMGTNNLNASV